MPNNERLEKKAKERAERRQSKRKPKMKVSGKSVIKLKELITGKGS